jgi:hypothetical protein
MVMSADIDIDFADRQQVLALIRHVPACQLQDGAMKKHNSGVYVTNIPVDAVAGHAAIDYRTAEQRGYFKIDFLNMSVYQLIRDPEHYDRVLSREPDWSRLWQDSHWAQQLVHVGNYTDLLRQMRPDSVTRMAAFISVIRPGKAHLQRQAWDQVFASVWDGDTQQGYTFKKSHALSYSMLVVLHMNLLSEINPLDGPG